MSRLRREAPWLGGALATTYVVWLVALLVDRRRYFMGDTQHAYYGWMYEYGHSLRDGEWPLLSVVTASAGNHVAEGQMGLYSPISALMALGSTVAPNLLVYATFLKFAIATVGIVGTYLLCRHLEVRPPLAAAASVVVPLCGLTLTAEAPRWITGQLVAALLPWAWWLTRRAMRGAHPLPAMVAGALVVTVGYVYGTLYLGLVLVGLLAGAVVTRDRAAFLRGLVVSVVSGLVAIAVYLPGVLTVPVTLRNTGVGGDGPFQLSYPDYLLLGSPVGTNGIHLAYVAWFLPLLLLVDVGSVRRSWRTLTPLLVTMGLFLAWSLGPYEIGPIRWPGRIMDAFALALAVMLAVLLQRHAAPVTRRRLGLLVGAMVVVTVLGYTVRHRDDILQGVLAVAITAALVLVAVGWQRPALVGAVLLAGSAVVGTVQVVNSPVINAPQRHMPTELSAYRDYLPGTEGDVFVVDEIDLIDLADLEGGELFTPRRSRFALTGSLWALTDKPVRNNYSTIGFRPYSLRFCTRVGGETCPDALDRMLRREPITGARRTDLYAVSSLVVGLNDRTRTMSPPRGWHEAGRTPYHVTWVRDEPVPGAGGVVWTSEGVEVREVATGPLGTSFEVTEVPAGGGTVVLSRIDWPGYRVDGARLVDPVDETLVTVQLDGDARGTRVEVGFRPPGWTLELAALGLAGLLALGATLLQARSSRAARRADAQTRRTETEMSK